MLVAGWHAQVPWGQGSPTATHWFGAVPFADPLAAIEVLLASQTAPARLWLGAGLALLVAVVLGRVFCGWLCPLGLLTELNDELRGWLRRITRGGPIRWPQVEVPKATKYWLLALIAGTACVASFPVFTAVSPINLLALACFSPSVPPWAILAAILLGEHFAPRAFCRAVCPLGAFYSLVGRFAVWRVRVRPDGEKLACRHCTLRCPMGISVMEDHVLAGRTEIADAECTRCGTCTDACAGHVLQLGFRRPRAVACPRGEQA